MIGGVEESYPEIDVVAGDLLQIAVKEKEDVTTRVEQVLDRIIWTADFMPDVWDIEWRRRAFDVSFTRGKHFFHFLMEIDGQDTEGNLKFTRIVRISKIKERQRRASFRIKYTFDIYLRPWTGMKSEKTRLDEDSGGFIKCKGIDISETGVGLESNVDFAPMDNVECKFEIEGEEYVFFAKIMRKMHCVKEQGGKSDSSYIYSLGIMFDDDDERMLKDVRKFVYKKQLTGRR